MAQRATGQLGRQETRDQEVKRLIRTYGLQRNGHAHFSPSGSSGWLNCKAFLLTNAGRPDGGGYDAAYGTVAHNIAAIWLTAVRDEGREAAEHVPARFLGYKTIENGHAIECDNIMLFHIRRYLDWCAEVEPLGYVRIEQRVDYSEYTPIPKQGGTADHFVMCPGHLIITDLKMGIGVFVPVEWNTQALLYALGVYLEWNFLFSFKKITIRICQPRKDYFGVWEISVDDMLKWAADVMRPAAEAAWKQNQPRSPGIKQCQWCDDKACVARSALLEDVTDDYFANEEDAQGGDPLAQSQFEILDGASPEYSEAELDKHAMTVLFGDKTPDKVDVRPFRHLETAVLSWRYKHRGYFEKFFREIGIELTRRTEAGQNTGWKLTDGRNSYAWRDEEYAVGRLIEAGLKRKDLYVSEVTSVHQAKEKLRAAGWKPKQIEALLYKSDVANPSTPSLAITKPGKPTLVLETDDRPGLEDAADDLFG